MSQPDAPLRVAVVQWPPRFLDLEGSLRVLAERSADAADQGARVVVFPESWLPGYPVWLDCAPGAALWDHAPAKEVFARLFENSVEVPGASEQRLGEVASSLGIVLVTGVHERRGGTLYNSILFHGPDGSLLGLHRKLVPTYSERMIWGQGEGSTLRAVDTPAGRIGGLVCWEHWMPLARQAMHEQQEFLHVALWPTVKEMHLVASRHYAFEGRCFVIAGGSAVIDPEGRVIAGPLGAEPGILLADLDSKACIEGRLTLDTAGHYARPDVFEFGVRAGDRNRKMRP